MLIPFLVGLLPGPFRPIFSQSSHAPAVRVAVDTFYFSALASVRPTTSSPHTLRCPRRSGHLLLLLRHWLCNIHRRMPKRLLGTPCRTGHRSESWAIPSLCRATPSATSEHLVELLGSSPIPRSFVASCVSFQLRLLPFTGVTRLRQYYEPLRHPKTAQPVSRELPVDPYCNHRWDFPCCAWSPLPACRRQYPGRSDGTCPLVPFHQLRPSHEPGRVGSCIVGFGACLAFSHVTASTLAQAPSDSLHQTLQQSPCLNFCSDCYRVERTSSRAGLTPAVDHRLFTAHPITRLTRHW